jgi:subtilisin family serine protease
MKRTLLAVAVSLALTLAGAAGVAAAVAPQQMMDAVVVLEAQADLSAIGAKSGPQRLRAVEGALRTKAAGAQRGVLALLHRRRAQHLVASVTPLWIVNEVSVRAAPSVIKELAARPDVREVRPDSTIQAPAPAAAADGAQATAPPEPNVALVNAPALWDLGFRGQGMVVANMDTGVDATHPDLAGRWRGGSNSWYDPNGEHPTMPTDVNGHGTWTMGAMVGGDAGGTSIGMAPDAQWIAVKLFNDRGTTTSSMVHLGFQWLLDPDGNPATADAPNVVNNSWSGSVAGCDLEFQPDLRSLRAAGILPVFSAGNSGPLAGTVLSPANLPEALSVGATDDSDAIYPSAAAGRRRAGRRSLQGWWRQGSASAPPTCSACTSTCPAPPSRRPMRPGPWRCCWTPSRGCPPTASRPRWRAARWTWAPPARTTTTATGASTRSPPTSGWPARRTSPWR